jgi:hypothetical protein
VTQEVTGLPAPQPRSPLLGRLRLETTGLAIVRPAQQPPSVRWFDVGPGFFATLGVPFVRGRDFTGADGPDSVRVAIVNQALVDRHARRDPIGRRVTAHDQTLGSWASKQRRLFRPDAPVASEIYWPKRQHRAGPFLLQHAARRRADRSAGARAQRQVNPEPSIGGLRRSTDLRAPARQPAVHPPRRRLSRPSL